MLIDALKTIQKQHGYLPENELKAYSERAKIPMYEIHGVASFYPHFRLVPPSEVRIQVCTDMSCHLNGACNVFDSLTETLGYAGIEGWDIQPVSCLGQCDGAPAVAINDQSYTHMTEDKLADYIIKLAEGRTIRKQANKKRTKSKHIDPYPEPLSATALKDFLATTDKNHIIETLKESGIRGMGGAGFPTGVKWDLVRQTSDEVKYVVCNADESEPGTFKDRELLRIGSHLVIEGMILGALVIGAKQGYIFLRHEYNREREIIDQTIRQFYNAGLLGNDISGSGFTFDLEIFDSPGGYICGEETALLEAMEGKRAEPRNKPPFPGTHGLHGKPTLINNVETFAWIPAIMKHGGPWFKNQGVNGAAGLKYFALSGHVKKPGVYEIPLGTTVRDLIQKYGGGISGGRTLKAFAPGGASSGFLPASMAKIPLDFKPLADAGSMLGSGAVVVVAEDTDMVDLARNVITFFRNESCGKCVPCRTGTDHLVRMLDQVIDGAAHPNTLAPVSDVAEAMSLTSICGLGQAASVPVTSVLKHFPEEIERYLSHE
jgi:NADH:ubiquinone oxidoreductase subunit F (NADH-binding)/NADH:ubiquinone oxidoreductase subunit E